MPITVRCNEQQYFVCVNLVHQEQTRSLRIACPGNLGGIKSLVFWEADMCKRLFPFLLLLPIGLFSLPQQTQKPEVKAAPAEFKIPPEAVKQPNPVKLSPESLAQGKRIYGYDCAMCHGADGDGKGDLAVKTKLKVPDFRDPGTLKDRTDGELFYIIKNGKGEMPLEGDRAKPDDLWSLVNFVRSFAKKEPGQNQRRIHDKYLERFEEQREDARPRLRGHACLGVDLRNDESLEGSLPRHG